MVHLAVFRPASATRSSSARSSTCPSTCSSNRTHITRVYEEDRSRVSSQCTQDPLSHHFWKRAEQRNKARDKQSVFDRLSRPKTCPAELTKKRAEVARSSLSLSPRSREFQRSLSYCPGSRSGPIEDTMDTKPPPYPTPQVAPLLQQQRPSRDLVC
eukprot:sb/3473161/